MRCVTVLSVLLLAGCSQSATPTSEARRDDPPERPAPQDPPPAEKSEPRQEPDPLAAPLTKVEDIKFEEIKPEDVKQVEIDPGTPAPPPARPADPPPEPPPPAGLSPELQKIDRGLRSIKPADKMDALTAAYRMGTDAAPVGRQVCHLAAFDPSKDVTKAETEALKKVRPDIADIAIGLASAGTEADLDDLCKRLSRIGPPAAAAIPALELGAKRAALNGINNEACFTTWAELDPEDRELERAAFRIAEEHAGGAMTFLRQRAATDEKLRPKLAAVYARLVTRHEKLQVPVLGFLAELGADARGALPAVRALKQSGKIEVRAAAIDAEKKITARPPG